MRSIAARQSAFWFAAFMLLLAALSPPEGLGFIGCPSRVVTGVPCPGCGITRSMTLLMRGRVSASLETHPFGVFILPLLAGIVLAGVGRALWPRQLNVRRNRLLTPAARFALLALLVSMAAWGVWRAIAAG